jgi:hypothetical protein
VHTYIFQADIYCETCGEEIKAGMLRDKQADGTEEDSDAFPQGPYMNGGGEADTPQHCASCRTFLENPLTPDGSTYVDEKANAAAKDYENETGKVAGEYSWQDVAKHCENNDRPALAEWILYYLAWGG